MSQRVTTYQDRLEIVHLKAQGYSLQQITDSKRLNRYTVRHWWRQYRKYGEAGLRPRPKQRPARGPLSTFDPIVRYVALRLKKTHPHWGPDLLLFKMSQRRSLQGKMLPSRSALAGYLQPYLPRLRKRYNAPARRPAQAAVFPQQVHECWQMDFKGSETVGECGRVVPFLVTDGLTSAPLAVLIHPDTRRGMTFRAVHGNLRATFCRWGLPDFIRMDRDPIFVGSGRLEWPGTLLLWLVGLGVFPIINPPFTPTLNACVERQGRTWNDHVAAGANYATLDEVQQASNQAWADRLAHLPSRNPICNGQPPLVACPQLAHPRRSFTLIDEPALFDFERVELYLSDWRWQRRVDRLGCISLADRNVYFQRACHKQTIEVTYDLTARAFLARTLTDDPSISKHFTLDFVAVDYILGLPPSSVDGG